MGDWYIKSGRNHSAFVQSTSQIDYNFSTPVIVNNLKFTNVTVLHHHSKEFDDYFGTGADKDLPFTTFLRIVDGFEGITQNIHPNHG